MKPRVTVSVSTDGEIEIWRNVAGRDLLVKRLLALNAHNDHLHLGTWPHVDIELAARPYRSGDKVHDGGKIHFRTDESDREHYPHVLAGAT